VSYDPVKVRLKFIVLALLAVKPSHGYELSKAIEEVTLGTLKASPGSLYPVLRELSSEGLVEEKVEVEGGRLRKVYTLTEKGWDELARVIEVAYSISTSINEILAVAKRKLEERGRRPCVPRDILERLSRLEERVRNLRKILEESACPEEAGNTLSNTS
jgi:DNA-binding PadR family transcriptional regulator